MRLAECPQGVSLTAPSTYGGPNYPSSQTVPTFTYLYMTQARLEPSPRLDPSTPHSRLAVAGGRRLSVAASR